MIVKPLPLLSVFAAGCLSGAVFIAFWRVDSADVPKSGLSERAMQSDASRTAQQQREPAIQLAVNDDRSAPRVEPASPKKDEHLGGESPTEPGTSVADVLTRLEAAYHERITAPRQGDTPNSEAPPPELPVRGETAVAVADPAPPPESVPRADAPTESDPQTDVRALARRDDAAPRYLYEGDVNQNVQVGNVHQGDVNNVQQDVNNVQQVVVLQYLQLLTISPDGQLASPAQKARRESKRHARPFSRSLTNPNNPWQFRGSAPRLGHVRR
jgi:hypothetical protein